jgi:6-phosphogluconolactonase (cycloisomerase 2 family)
MVHVLSVLVAARAAAAVNLWATSYNDHTVTSLELKGKSLTVLGKNLDCGTQPTWLTLDKAKNTLYCLNEGWDPPSSITAYKTKRDGSLETLDILPVLKSPVSSTLYGPGNSGLFVAHYDTSSVTTYSVKNPKDLGLVKNETYTMSGKGPNPDRQEIPHEHDAVLDPTGKFVLVPDLGADLVRVYKLAAGSVDWTAQAPVKAVAGSGPRHAAFATLGGNTYFYTYNELSNTVTGYKVRYTDGAISFTQLFDISSHGEGGSVPAGTKAAEIEVSPDNRYIILSSRNEASLDIPAFNGTGTIKSDPLITFSINERSGTLCLVQIAPAGGMNPRGFSLNKKGDLVASALQDDNRVVIIKRDLKTGKLGEFVAWATVGGPGPAGPSNNGPNYVLFDE